MIRKKNFLLAIIFLLPCATFAGHMERRQAAELTDFQFVQVNKKNRRQIGSWMPGKVPGDVISDLVNAGRLKDPYVDFNSRDALWVNDYDWLYKTGFNAEVKNDERVWILFHGIDYESQGFLNGKQMFNHTGMFSRVLVDATPFLKKGEPNELEIKLIGLKNRAHVKNYQVDQFIEQLKRRKVTKTQMSFGWDIAVELINAGIWDTVEMFKTGPVMIADLGIHTQNNGDLSLDVSLDSNKSAKVYLKFTITPEIFGNKQPVLIREFPLELSPGRSEQKLKLKIDNPALWWVPELGAPNLYRMKVEVLLGEQASDSIEETFGFRSITWEQNPGAPEGWKWVMRLNGKRVFLRGANWVPPDALPGRLTNMRYAELLNMASDAHINILRVWGGGNREREAFYETADRLGIMLWQEFPFACVYAPPYPTDKKFTDLAGREVSEIVLNLRNHPSVALYSGGNEFLVSSNRKLVGLMRKIVSELDPARRFIAASPAEGDSHNWIVWHQRGNLLDYFADEHALMSEFGIQSFASGKTIEKYFSPGLREPIGEVYKHHDLEYDKIMKYASVVPHPDSLEGLLTASQQIQAYYYQRAIEHWRIRKYRVSGTLFWMFDEPWPAMVGSVIDYGLVPKLAYFQMKDSYNPLLIAADLPVQAWKPGDDFVTAIYLVNDFSRKFTGLKIEARTGGQLVGTWAVDAEPDSTVKIATLKLKLPDNQPPTLELFVRQSDQVVSHNLYDLSICDSKPSGKFNSSLEKLTKKIMAGGRK